MRYEKDEGDPRDYYDAEIDWLRMGAWLVAIGACVWIWARLAYLIAGWLA